MLNRLTPLYSKIYYKEENYLKVKTVVFKYITSPYNTINFSLRRDALKDVNFPFTLASAIVYTYMIGPYKAEPNSSGVRRLVKPVSLILYYRS